MATQTIKPKIDIKTFQFENISFRGTRGLNYNRNTINHGWIWKGTGQYILGPGAREVIGEQQLGAMPRPMPPRRDNSKDFPAEKTLGAMEDSFGVLFGDSDPYLQSTITEIIDYSRGNAT
ncbi:hypothetical protein K449DRAFT_436159 [Hypoxylon sp. EC38]|nr:hypothetical protein K449DRAFT_436159 [Hypoxylon sp. EC38]